MEAAVEEMESRRTPTTTINPKEVPEETQPQHSGTTAEEKGEAGTTSDTKTEADNVGKQENLIKKKVSKTQLLILLLLRI